MTKTRIESNVFFRNRSSHKFGIILGSGAGSRNRRSTEMLSSSVNEHVVNKVEAEKSRIIKKIAQRNETYHPGEDHSHHLERYQAPQDFYAGTRPNTQRGTRPNTSISRRLSTLTKLLMCLSRCSDRFLRFSLCTQRVGEGYLTSEFGSDFRYCKRA